MIVLASASPRRQQLLRNAGISFVAQAADISEAPGAGEAPAALAERLAREKAEAVFRQRPNDLVVGADTIVVVEGQILGKPRDASDATRMLRLLSGRSHQVITGICVLGRGCEEVRSESTLVTVRGLTDQDIHSYVATGEPMDKAGAYAIQGLASRWISRIEGDYFNVVGLPVSLVYGILRERGAI
jgi:septum formation protein